MHFLMMNWLRFRGGIRISKSGAFFFLFRILFLQCVFRYNGWGVSLVDSLDTMWIMGLREEFDRALGHVAGMNFTIRSVSSGPSIPYQQTKVMTEHRNSTHLFSRQLFGTLEGSYRPMLFPDPPFYFRERTIWGKSSFRRLMAHFLACRRTLWIQKRKSI